MSKAKIELIGFSRQVYTKVDVFDVPSMDSRRFEKIKIGLERNGIAVIQDSEGDSYLRFMGAEAMTLSDASAVIFQSSRIPSASAVFEEVIHATQIRENGPVSTYGNKNGAIEYLNREIEANEKLLKNRKNYRLTDKDIESVEINLAQYYAKLKEVIGDV